MTTKILCTADHPKIPIRFCDMANELSYRDRTVTLSASARRSQPLCSTFLERCRPTGRRLAP
ncbi:hypothetical protein D9R13_22135 [Mycobacteroides abscessus subsp. massiliense]|nr:hypothetical protein D2E80_21790 [Mycobacteroides abscessus]RRE00556.1 hypothetical protein D9R13_22135 [Mycobacteroides abscessus subsp. massiliense]